MNVVHFIFERNHIISNFSIVTPWVENSKDAVGPMFWRAYEILQTLYMPSIGFRF